jgi:hypothetical protein
MGEQKVIIKRRGKTDFTLIKEKFDSLEVIKAKYAVKSRLLPEEFELELELEEQKSEEIIYNVTKLTKISDKTEHEKKFSEFLYESNFIRLDIDIPKPPIQVISTEIVRTSVRLIVKFMIPPETKLIDLFNNFVTDKKYPCIQYQKNFKFQIDFQIGEVIEIDGLVVYSERPKQTAKTIDKYDRIIIDPETKFTDQEYTNLFRMDFNAEITEDEQGEAKKILQRLTGVENIPESPELPEISVIEEEDEYELSRRQLIELNEEEKKISGTSLDTPLRITSMTYSDIFATFYIPIEEVDMEFYILQDLILNDDNFLIMAVDERMRAGRERDTLYLYMKNGNVRCNLSLGHTDSEATVRKELSKIGSRSKKYLSIRVTRITELEDLDRLKIVIERMFGLYLQKYKEVEDDYAEYMVIEPVTARKKGKGKKARKAGEKLKEVDSVTQELFGEGTYYSFICARPQQPDILELPERYYEKSDDKQKNKYEIVFPIPPYRNKQYLFNCSTGERKMDEGEEEWKGERKILISNPKRRETKNMYAGLKKNTSTKAKLDTSQRHPYVPCCFPKPLKFRTNPSGIKDITREYFQGEYGFGKPPKEERDDTGRQQSLETLKILKKGQKGRAPSSVTDLLYKVSVKRIGSDRTLFGCVIDALNIEVEDIKNEIDSDLRSLSTESDQVSYLEDKFDVNIWIFSNEEASKVGGRAREGKLIDTKRGISFELHDKNIVIFHNYGGAAQKGDSYELIQSTDKLRTGIFKDEIVDSLKYVFRVLYPYRVVDKIEGVTGQSGIRLEIGGKIYETPERIPRYAVRILEDDERSHRGKGLRPRWLGSGCKASRRVFLRKTCPVPKGRAPGEIPSQEEKILKGGIAYYGIQGEDVYTKYLIKQRKIYTILEYAKYAFSNFLKDIFHLTPSDSYQETMDKLEVFHASQDYYFIGFQNEKCEEEKQIPDFDYTKTSFIDDHPLYLHGKLIYPNIEFLARVIFNIRQQLFIDEMSLVNYYKRKNFGSEPSELGTGVESIPYIKPPSIGERLIRSYDGMRLLTITGGCDSTGIRDLKSVENLQTQFVSFRDKEVYSLVRNDDINNALKFSKKCGMNTSSYIILSYDEKGELKPEPYSEEEKKEKVTSVATGAGSGALPFGAGHLGTLIFNKFDKYFSMIPYATRILKDAENF